MEGRRDPLTVREKKVYWQVKIAPHPLAPVVQGFPKGVRGPWPNGLESIPPATMPHCCVYCEACVIPCACDFVFVLSPCSCAPLRLLASSCFFFFFVSFLSFLFSRFFQTVDSLIDQVADKYEETIEPHNDDVESA